MSSPDAAGDAAAPIGAVSLDAFQDGAFHLLQPVARGYRSGLDALLLAACVAHDWSGRAADLGSGAGAVGLAAAVRAPGLSLVLVERDPVMAGLARASLALEQNARLAPRLKVAEADLLGGRAGREAAGLADASLDLVLTNPPFHPHGSRASPDAMRRDAKSAAAEGSLREWVRVASALLRDRGRLLMIARPENLADILNAAENRLGDLAILPVHTKAGQPARRILVAAIRGSQAPVRLMPGLMLEDGPGRASAIAGAIARGSSHPAGLLR